MSAMEDGEPARVSERLLAWALFDLRVLLSRYVREAEAQPDVRAAAELAYAVHNLALASLGGSGFTKEQFLDALRRADATTEARFEDRFRKTFSDP